MGLGRRIQPAKTPPSKAMHSRHGSNFSVKIFTIVKTPPTKRDTKKKFRCRNVEAKVAKNTPQTLPVARRANNKLLKPRERTWGRSMPRRWSKKAEENNKKNGQKSGRLILRRMQAA